MGEWDGWSHQRGPIVDTLGMAPGGRALCTCVHGKEWSEGDLFEDAGGKACRECFEEATRVWHRENPEKGPRLAAIHVDHRTGEYTEIFVDAES